MSDVSHAYLYQWGDKEWKASDHVALDDTTCLWPLMKNLWSPLPRLLVLLPAALLCSHNAALEAAVFGRWGDVRCQQFAPLRPRGSDLHSSALEEKHRVTPHLVSSAPPLLLSHPSFSVHPRLLMLCSCCFWRTWPPRSSLNCLVSPC